MEIDLIKTNAKGDANEFVKSVLDLKSDKKDLTNQSHKVEDFIKQYDPKGHAVKDPAKRKDKTKKNSSGNTEQVPVSRLPVSLQKIITKRAISFLLGNPIKLKEPMDAKPEVLDLLDMVRVVWENSKLNYLNKEIAKILFSETEVAELWFTEPAEPGYYAGTKNESLSNPRKLRTRILSESKGDKLHPVFNEMGDMIAFGRQFKGANSEGKKADMFSLYTEDSVYKYQKGDNWTFIDQKPHGFNKIPVIYYSMDWPIWFDVQELIERFETRLSNFADTNDYFGDPIVVAKGKIEGFADKGESGKFLQLANGAEADYLTWEHAPESTKLEFETLIKLIYSLSQTPDISFESVKGIGQVSGIALELLFMDAHLKAKDNETIFGVGVQRRLNFICHALGLINAAFEPVSNSIFKPVFTPYMPSNVKEMVAILSDGLGGKAVMSQKTAVSNNPLVEDIEEELKEMKNDSLGGLEE